MSDAIIEKIERLSRSDPIRLETVDFTINESQRLRDNLGSTFQYFGRVENEVAHDPLLLMFPKLGTEYGGFVSHGVDFLDVWVPQENAHGKIFDQIMINIGLVPEKSNSVVSWQNILLHNLGTASDSLHMVGEMIYLSRGAMHERLTARGYELMVNIFNQLGETALLQTALQPIQRQEAGHLGYYRAAAQDLKKHLSPWQLWLTKYLSIKTYKPVGVNRPHEEPAFGIVTSQLAGDNADTFSLPIQKIAEELLTNQDTPLPKFVIRAIEKCMQS